MNLYSNLCIRSRSSFWTHHSPTPEYSIQTGQEIIRKLMNSEICYHSLSFTFCSGTLDITTLENDVNRRRHQRRTRDGVYLIFLSLYSKISMLEQNANEDDIICKQLVAIRDKPRLANCRFHPLLRNVLHKVERTSRKHWNFSLRVQQLAALNHIQVHICTCRYQIFNIHLSKLFFTKEGPQEKETKLNNIKFNKSNEPVSDIFHASKKRMRKLFAINY